jgi:hypothetical protein
MLGQAVGSSGANSPRPPRPSPGHALRWTTMSGNATLAPHSLLACVGYGVRFEAARQIAAAVPAYIRARRSFYRTRLSPGMPARRSASPCPARARNARTPPLPSRLRLGGRPAGRPPRRVHARAIFNDKASPTSLKVNAEPRPHRRIRADPDRRSHVWTFRRVRPSGRARTSGPRHPTAGPDPLS